MDPPPQQGRGQGPARGSSTPASTHDAVVAVTGGFPDRPVVAVTPCGSNNAPSTCPAPPASPNSLGSLNPWTGQVTALTVGGVPFTPQGGLLFVGRTGRSRSRVI